MIQAREKTHASNKALHMRLEVPLDRGRGQRPVLMAHSLRKGREVTQPLRIKRDQKIAIGKRMGVRPGLDPIRRECLDAP